MTSADRGPAGQRVEPGAWPLQVTVGYLVVVLIWGTTWYGIHTQVNGTSPHVGVALRMAAASMIFLAMAAVTRRSLKLTPAQVRLVIIEGVCFFGLNYLAAYAGSQYLTSGVVAVVLSLTVPFNLLADRVVRGVRPTAGLMLAAALGTAGIGLVFGSELGDVLADRQRWWGAGIVAASAILVAIGNVVAARLMDARVGWMTVNAFGMAAGSAAVLVWAVVTGAPWVLEPTATWLAGYLYLVVLGSVVAFGIYMRILPTIGTTAGAYVTVLSPVLALVVSAWLEGLELRPMIYAGVVLLLIGHSLLIRQRARRPRS